METTNAIWAGLANSKDQISSISAIITVLAALGALLIAYSGLQSWKKELKGKSAHEKAKYVLRALKLVRQAFVWVRIPWDNAWDYPRETRDEKGGLKKEFEYEGTEYLYNNRTKALTAAMDELKKQTLDAQIEWEHEFDDAILPIARCYSELLIVIQTYVESKRNDLYRREWEKDKKLRFVLHYQGENIPHDEFTSKINDAIQEYEIKIRSHMVR